MLCPKCGSNNNEGAAFCSSCGSNLRDSVHSNYYKVSNEYNSSYNNWGNVPNHLVESILATVFCCLPFGIPAIVFSSQVDSLLRVGDYEGALEASRKAKTWCWVAFGCGVAAAVIYLIFFMLRAAAEP
jgi:uncharacterized membrane protein YvbJ